MGEIYYAGGPEYNAKVYKLRVAIEKNEVGQVIIGGIKDSEKDLIFVPRDQKRLDEDLCGVETHIDNPSDGAPKGASAKGPNFWYNPGVDDPSNPVPVDERLVPSGYIATGDGSNIHIYFSPDAYTKSSCDSRGPGSLPDEALLHEMVHALRGMQGKFNQIPMPDRLKDYYNQEEFLAIVVTNVYISAKGGTRLRAGHGFEPLKPPLNTSSGFLTDPDNLKLMSIYRLVWHRTFTALSLVLSARFNPFRELAANLAYLGPVSD